MPRERHYSPQLSRFMVSVLYHEAKARKMPMTKLTDQLLRQSLSGSGSWRRHITPPLHHEHSRV